MRTKSMQRGMGFWGLLMVMGLIAFFTILGLKLLPPYIQYGKVKTALENVGKQPDAGNLERGEIKAALDRRFAIEDINDIDLNKALTVEKKPGVTTLRVAYERRVPLMYNITALIEFDHSVQVNAR